MSLSNFSVGSMVKSPVKFPKILKCELVSEAYHSFPQLPNLIDARNAT